MTVISQYFLGYVYTSSKKKQKRNYKVWIKMYYKLIKSASTLDSFFTFLVNKTDETLPKTGVVKLVQI